VVLKNRVKRIAERIQNDLSELMVYQVSDPRLAGVSITGVRVDRELAYADVYVSAVEGSQRAEEILSGLESATGYLRRELAHRIELRIFPRLRFHWDPTPERADRIDALLASLHQEEHSEEETAPHE